MFGSQISWNMVPFGPIIGAFMPVTEFSCSAAVKIEEDDENGRTRVTGRELQTCDFTIKVSRATGGNPRLIFEMLDQLKGFSGSLIVTNGAGLSLANNVLDSLQTSDWSKYLTMDGATQLATSLFMGSSLGGVSFMLTRVEIVSEILLSDGDIHTAEIRLSFLEDAGQRQSGGLKVYLNDKEITEKISVTECIYESFAGEEADNLFLKFADTKNQWAGWQPKNEDMIKITDGVINSGGMFIESLKPEGGQYCLTAYSVPKTAFNKKSRSFEKLSLPQIAKKIADDNKLSVKNYGVPETKTPYVQQRGKSDLAFLSERCRLAGASFIIFNKELCIFDEKTIENKAPTKVITLGLDVDAKFTDDTQNAYSSAQVTNSSYTGTAADKDIASGKSYVEKVNENVFSTADMNRIGQSLLRHANKQKRIGEISMKTCRELAAGSVVNIIARGWQGAAFVYHCRHDLKKKRTRFWIRKPLSY